MYLTKDMIEHIMKVYLLVINADVFLCVNPNIR